MGRRKKRSQRPGKGGKSPIRQRVKEHPGGGRVVANDSLAVADRRLPLIFLQNKRARRIIIRLDHGASRIVVVLPARATRQQAHRFLLANKGWIRDRLDLMPPRRRFRHGAVIPFLGREHRIRHRPRAAGVWQADGVIHVGGPREELARRVGEWLRTEARRELLRRAKAKAQRLGRPIAGVTLRDPKTRWGSCSPSGVLSFSWRLVLAPRTVVDYVVAHEVAHLKELNHGQRFWKLTGTLTRHAASARAWLMAQGPALQRYG